MQNKNLAVKMADADTGRWIAACNVEDIKPEDVRRWDFEGHLYAIFRSPDGEFYATDDICTHEHAHLSDGFVEDDCIECPRHAGRFSYMTGEALGAPVCIDLQTHPVRVEGGKVEVLVV